MERLSEHEVKFLKDSLPREMLEWLQIITISQRKEISPVLKELVNKTTACPDVLDEVKHLAWFDYEGKHRGLFRDALSSYLYELCVDRFMMSYSIFVFVAHPVACVSTFGLLSCKEMDGELRLFRDSSQKCWDDEHSRWFASLGIVGLFFILFIPIYTYTMMNTYAAELKSGERRWTRRYAFVFSDFKDEYIYWESVIQSRKLCMAAVVAVLPAYVTVQTQTVIALGILVLCIALQVSKRPYEAQKIDEMEIYSLLCSFLTLYFGLFLSLPVDSAGDLLHRPSVKVGLTMMIVAVNVIFVGRFVWLLMSIVRAR